jgi:hypothetical protein
MKYYFQNVEYTTYSDALAARGEALSEVEPGQCFGLGAFDITEKEDSE